MPAHRAGIHTVILVRFISAVKDIEDVTKATATSIKPDEPEKNALAFYRLSGTKILCMTVQRHWLPTLIFIHTSKCLVDKCMQDIMSVLHSLSATDHNQRYTTPRSMKEVPRVCGRDLRDSKSTKPDEPEKNALAFYRLSETKMPCVTVRRHWLPTLIFIHTSKCLVDKCMQDIMSVLLSLSVTDHSRRDTTPRSMKEVPRVWAGLWQKISG
ncbi:uncharacterized protein EDB91DRAFT_896291 [Suillus paluster]|uniref:uncharacterized protein n=1 Tax=Suillus paluster TaxID=48578 RepID=UPI001B860611|nr:uncharacterized protein EDB91DRAFT_896291 [Suillus paluster]KAG1727185.1 hypothetical protein EDB91DRAFT_896291 [Suillus paluster]